MLGPPRVATRDSSTSLGYSFIKHRKWMCLC